jgi:hypothetical protein
MPAASRVSTWVLLSWLAVGGFVSAAVAADTESHGARELAAGRALYMEGRRADGTPLQGRGYGGMLLSGSQAACVNCHRPSGLGSTEGRSYIPAITADMLLEAMPPGQGPSATGVGRPAYSPATLQSALRTGVDPGGRALGVLMPRYELSAEEVRALLRYLADRGQAPLGVPETGPLHFATVIAPGVPPSHRKAMVEVLHACFAEHNAGRPDERGRRKLATHMTLQQPSAWQLHVWELHGQEGQWEAQLARLAAQQPVFALVGGLGGGTWSPVHRFCERSQRPCLFPHLEVPVDSPGALYSVYLSRAVLLESALIAQHLSAVPTSRPVVQVVRSSDRAAMEAAAALARLLDAARVPHELVQLKEPLPSAGQLPAASKADSLFVLWLRSGDLQRFAAAAPPPAQVFVSATLAGQDAVPLPPDWKARALMAYPFELPALRADRTRRLHEWLRSKGLGKDSERIRSDALLACTALRSGMQDAQGRLGADYLVEKLEANIERWGITGLYPRLALGPGQRFASKTGYLVRFTQDSGQLAAAGERLAP